MALIDFIGFLSKSDKMHEAAYDECSLHMPHSSIDLHPCDCLSVSVRMTMTPLSPAISSIFHVPHPRGS